MAVQRVVQDPVKKQVGKTVTITVSREHLVGLVVETAERVEDAVKRGEGIRRATKNLIHQVETLHEFDNNDGWEEVSSL